MVQVTQATPTTTEIPVPQNISEKTGNFISRSWTAIAKNIDCAKSSKIAAITSVFAIALSVLMLAELAVFGASSLFIAHAAYGVAVVAPSVLTAILFPNEAKTFFQEINPFKFCFQKV